MKARKGNLASDLMRLRKTELVGTWIFVVITSPAYFAPIENLSTQTEYISQLDSGKEFVFRNSINSYQQAINMMDYSFSGEQISSFSEAHIVGAAPRLDWVVGVNLWTENFEQKSIAAPLALDSNSQTAGVFAQGTFFFGEHWHIESGLRVDSSSELGNFVLPRASLLYSPSEKTSLRVGGGCTRSRTHLARRSRLSSIEAYRLLRQEN